MNKYFTFQQIYIFTREINGYLQNAGSTDADTDLADATDSTDLADLANSTDLADSTDSADSTNSANSVDLTDSDFNPHLGSLGYF